MRPVRLDIEGFASFREPAHLDLTEVDYFALVGNTGAGKSTLIDAITFALYGTAPRWEHESSVANALAPTSNRAVVSLIFDIGGQRYQVVREVRRASTTGAVTQKNARLERFLDPTACPAPGDAAPETEDLAHEVRHVTPAVEQLIGLDFSDFCQCVVLPQGQFASFLKAKPRKRQDILLKLLGAEHYTQIGAAAGIRARDARSRIEVYQQQLAGLMGATPEALAAATERHGLLDRLVQRVPELLEPVLAARQEVERLTSQAREAEAGNATLAQVQAPAGVTERGADLVRARDLAASAAGQVAAAEGILDVSAAAAEAGPRRHELEHAERNHVHLEQLLIDQDTAAALLTNSEAAATTAAHAAQAALDEESAARGDETEAANVAHVLGERVQDVAKRLTRLDAIKAPTDLAADAARSSEAGRLLESAESSLIAATQAAATCAAAVADLPTRAELEQAAEDLDRVQELVPAWLVAQDAAPRDLETARAAAEAAQDAETSAEKAWARLTDLRNESLAATLRTTLQLGRECPVCAQDVATLPPAGDASPALEAAEAETTKKASEARTAKRAADEADRTAHRASESLSSRSQALEENTHRIRTSVEKLATRAGLTTTVDGGFGPEATLDAVRSLLHEVRQARRDADQNLAELRDTLAVARTERDAARESSAAVVAASLSAHRSLILAHGVLEHVVAEGDVVETMVRFPAAPTRDPADTSGIVSGWDSVIGWVRSQVEGLRDIVLPALRADEAAAAEAHAATAARLATATATSSTTSKASMAAAVAAAEVRTRVETLATAITEVGAALLKAPARGEISALLAEADRLARDRDAAQSALTASKQALAKATQEQSSAASAVIADRDALAKARDRTARWSPPSFASARLDDDLAGCWTTFAAWAAVAAAEQGAVAKTAADAVGVLEMAAAGATTTLSAAFAELELDGTAVATTPERGATVAEVARTEAAAAVRTLGAELARVEDTHAKMAEATEEAEVSEQLKALMRSDQFPEWLAGAALDTLVVGASSSLEQLSDGQFSLVHAGGDFHVIDHFDADSTRSVKTLSGGETFQASLALALALSEQLAALAAGGTSRIESIFLDEGFGTLDPESLDMVAASLENLARGDRLVGIVTHVAALAERVNVRFRVTNDQQTSRVEMESE